MTISVSPFTTSNFTGSFVNSSQGLVQGTASDDPMTRQALSGGVVYASETYPMWGGIAITEIIPTAGYLVAAGMLGPTLKRATTIATVGSGITGFIVTDQAYNGIITTGSPVPLFVQGGTAHFYRLGSRAKVNVQIDTTLATNLLGNAYNTQVAWDFTNQKLSTFSSGTALDVKVLDIQTGNSKTITYNTSTGLATYSETGAVATILI
jgi:hypothetical protein